MLRNEYYRCSEAYHCLRKLCIEAVSELLRYQGDILPRNSLLTLFCFRFCILFFYGYIERW